MKVLFLTIGRMKSIENKGLYTDLLRYFRENNHQIYTVSPYERREKKKTCLTQENKVNMLHVKIGNITRCNLIEKGISTLLIEHQFIRAIKKHLKNTKFDMVIYSTPPITFVNAVKYLKKRDQAKTYLLLKDIFPQNAVDIGMMKKNGMKGLLYRYFRKKERRLYEISDRIGCMSQANVDYILEHNPELDPLKVEICPNSIDVTDMSVDIETRDLIRKKYDIPIDKKVFVYGGNLGRPQGIRFMIECLKSQEKNENAFFLIVGYGTEYGELEAYIKNSKPKNVRLMKRLSREDYDKLVGACDVGLIFLDYRFTIPNFPSRLLGYMQAKLPVLACTDPNTDVGKVIMDGGFGWWCESNDTRRFGEFVKEASCADLAVMGENAWKYLNENYTVEESYKIIEKWM